MYCSMIYTIHRHVTNLDEYSLLIYIEYSNYNRRQLVVLYVMTIIEIICLLCLQCCTKQTISVNFPHVLVPESKNAAFLMLIFPFHKINYNYFSCS